MTSASASSHLLTRQRYQRVRASRTLAMPPLSNPVESPRIGSRDDKRWQIFVMIRTRIVAGWLTALATDISVSGIRLKTLNPLRVEQKIWLKFPNADQRLITVVWADGLVSGCVFAEPLAEYLLHDLCGSTQPLDPFDRSEGYRLK